MADKDPAIVEALELWNQKRAKEALNVLSRRISELADREPSKSGRASGCLIGLVFGIALAGIVAVALFMVLRLKPISDDEQHFLDMKQNFENGTPYIELAFSLPIPSLTAIPSSTVIPTQTATSTPRFTLTPLLTPTLTPMPTLDLYERGAEKNPIPVGEPIQYEAGTLYIKQLRRPVDFCVYRSESYGRCSDPIKGAEYIGIFMSFTCSEARLTCEILPEAVISLVLSNGLIVENQGVYPEGVTKFGPAEKVAGGFSTDGWEVFEIPQDTDIIALRVDPLNIYENIVYAALPDSQPTTQNDVSTVPPDNDSATMSTTYMPMPRKRYYAIVTADIRTCPSLGSDCPVIYEIDRGVVLMIEGIIIGEEINGNSVWYATILRTETGFIHSSMVSETRPQ